jgi:hypothetical protein
MQNEGRPGYSATSRAIFSALRKLCANAPDTAEGNQLPNKMCSGAIVMEHALHFEAAYWGDCTNTFDEEQKHYVYARCMGLERKHFSFDVHSKRILDIGGGPVSMLLKCINLREGKVCDPLSYPDWVYERYKIKGITAAVIMGEDISEAGWDEVWIYNVLQHAADPRRVIANACTAAPILRIFEWIDIPPHEGHPHMLTKPSLTEWLGQPGQVDDFKESGCFGRAFYGIFKTSQ